eukprot:1292440-Rhodomonas_salina.2
MVQLLHLDQHVPYTLSAIESKWLKLIPLLLEIQHDQIAFGNFDLDREDLLVSVWLWIGFVC